MERNDLDVIYWDVVPGVVKGAEGVTGLIVPISIRGNPDGEISFQSANPDVAWVKDGMLHLGENPGATVITAEASKNGLVCSRRHILVDLPPLPPPSGPIPIPELDWQPSGYVEQLEDGTWHFYYFRDWFDEYGNNIHVTGELSVPVVLNQDYVLRFDVWGQIESVNNDGFDTLDFYVEDTFIKRFNPTDPLYGMPLQPCPIPRRTESISLSEYTGQSVNLRFVWDTWDELYQKFDGWFIADIELIPQE